MQDFNTRISTKYNDIVAKIIEMNKKYIKPKKIPTEEFTPPEFLKVVIPKIQRQPFYRYFTNTNINMEGVDDPILRFVPFIDSEQEYTSITNFEDTLLNEEPLTKEQAIKEKFLRDEVFYRFTELSLHRLKSKIDQDSSFLHKNNAKSTDNIPLVTLQRVSTKLKMPIQKILEIWVQNFDQNPKPLYFDPDAFNYYFCSVCLMFECNTHECSTLRVPRFEEHTTNSACSEECVFQSQKSAKLFDEVNNKPSFDDATIKLCKIITKCFSLTSCELKLFLNYFSENETEKTNRQYREVNCNSDPINNVNFKEKIEQESTKHSNFTRQKFTCKDAYILLSQFPVPQYPYQKQRSKFAPSIYKKKHTSEAYLPCVHPGPCFLNKECRCYMHKTFCETSCHCENCDLLFKGCECESNKHRPACKFNFQSLNNSNNHTNLSNQTASAIHSRKKQLNYSKNKASNNKIPNNIEKTTCACLLNQRECTSACRCINFDISDVMTEDESTDNIKVIRGITLGKRGHFNKSTNLNQKKNRIVEKQHVSMCYNQCMSHLKEIETYAAPSNIEGYGLFTKTNIPKNHFIISYTGEIITNCETERRGLFYEKRKLSYLFDLSKIKNIPFKIVDATKIGNKARFINHSSQPNLQARSVQIDGSLRIAFYATREIKQDEELFFDYCYKEEQKKVYDIKD